MFSALDAVLRTRLASLGSTVANVLIAHHPPAENRPFLSARQNTGGLKFGDQLQALALCQAGVAPDLGGVHWLAVHGQMAVGLALMRDAQHLEPQAASGDAARLQSHVFPPVGRIELERRSLHCEPFIHPGAAHFGVPFISTVPP